VLLCAAACDYRHTPETGDSLGARAAPPAVSVGPLVGAVGADGATVMLRVERDAELSLQASEDPSLTEDLVDVGPVTATPETDRVAMLRLEGLEPDTLYHYRVLCQGEALTVDPARSFSTAPQGDAGFTFGVIADVSGRDGAPSESYETLGSLEPAFVLQIGDQDHRDPGAVDDPSIEVWRKMHRDQLAQYSQGQVLDRVLLATTPYFHTWDDHDYGKNNADGSAPWKPVAQRAYFEYFPVPPDIPNPDEGIWYSFRWGQAEIFMLDLRSQRAPDDKPDGPDKSMLAGWKIADDQKSWLKERLLDSTVTWKILVSGSVWNPHSKQVDSWALYPDEQQELLAFIADNGITGVVVLSGDLHSGGGIDDGTHSGVPEMNVPTTNLDPTNCTGDVCGAWSEGIHNGNSAAGFSTVDVAYDEVSSEHTLTLRTWSAAGEERISLEVGG